MLKSVFFSERKLLNAVLRVKLKYINDVSFSWNEMLFAMKKTDFHVLELYCRASHIRASKHRITSLEILRTLMLCLVQLSKWRDCQATDAEKRLFQWEKVAKCSFKSKAQVHKLCFFLMKLNVICNAEDRFSCVRAFLQSKLCKSFNAQNHYFRASKNTNAVFSATKHMKRMQGHICWKASFSVRESCLMQF